jgi:hypothetical protein
MEKLKPKLWENASKEEPSMPVIRVTWVEPSTLPNWWEPLRACTFKRTKDYESVISVSFKV